MDCTDVKTRMNGGQERLRKVGAVLTDRLMLDKEHRNAVTWEQQALRLCSRVR